MIPRNNLLPRNLPTAPSLEDNLVAVAILPIKLVPALAPSSPAATEALLNQFRGFNRLNPFENILAALEPIFKKVSGTILVPPLKTVFISLRMLPPYERPSLAAQLLLSIPFKALNKPLLLLNTPVIPPSSLVPIKAPLAPSASMAAVGKNIPSTSRPAPLVLLRNRATKPAPALAPAFSLAPVAPTSIAVVATSTAVLTADPPPPLPVVPDTALVVAFCSASPSDSFWSRIISCIKAFCSLSSLF